MIGSSHFWSAIGTGMLKTYFLTLPSHIPHITVSILHCYQTVGTVAITISSKIHNFSNWDFYSAYFHVLKVLEGCALSVRFMNQNRSTLIKHCKKLSSFGTMHLQPSVALTWKYIYTALWDLTFDLKNVSKALVAKMQHFGVKKGFRYFESFLLCQYLYGSSLNCTRYLSNTHSCPH